MTFQLISQKFVETIKQTNRPKSPILDASLFSENKARKWRLVCSQDCQKSERTETSSKINFHNIPTLQPKEYGSLGMPKPDRVQLRSTWEITIEISKEPILTMGCCAYWRSLKRKRIHRLLGRKSEIISQFWKGISKTMDAFKCGVDFKVFNGYRVKGGQMVGGPITCKHVFWLVWAEQ